MSHPRKICVVTGSRADYGLLYCLLKRLSEDPSITLQIIATGAHLSETFGLTSREIEKDGFKISEKIPILSEGDSIIGATKALGVAVQGFATAVNRLSPDLVVVLGDRFEIHAAVQAALIAKVPVAHIAGGDITEGAFDDALRHSITKMSHLHFVTNEESRNRVAQMGEPAAFIFNVGSPALERIQQMKFLSRHELERLLKFKFQPINLLITFHPATLDLVPSPQRLRELLKALDMLKGKVGLIFTKPNADPEGQALIQMIDRYVKQRDYAKAYESLGQVVYFSLMKQVNGMVGNSSSGIYEAPSFHIPTVNIGDRQKGRNFASSVISCEPSALKIHQAVKQALKLDCSKTKNPYGDGGASQKIFHVLKSIRDPKQLIKKRFVDRLIKTTPSRVYVIAEAGVNHNGSLARAKKMVDVAAEAGADAVKFQVFKAERLVSRTAKKAEYQQKNKSEGKTQFDMLKKLELSESDFKNLADHCRLKKIDFLATPFDEQSADFLTKRIRVKVLKVPSGEITNLPLLVHMAISRLPFIVSTGMAMVEEIETALKAIAFGYIAGMRLAPTQEHLSKTFLSFEAQQILQERVTLLHCTSAYPTPIHEINLRAMDTLRDRFDLRVGLSDHSQGIVVALAAAAKGASVIEKHFTLDRSLDGPDHQASLEPGELKEMIASIREIETILGSPSKIRTASEIKNLIAARKSIVAAHSIRKGEAFTKSNLAIKRPGEGLSPICYWSLLGQKATKNYQADELIIFT